MPDTTSTAALKKASSDQPARHWLDSWHVDPRTNREYDFIDGLRGLAILMVLPGHSIYARVPAGLAGRYRLRFAGTFGEGFGLPAVFTAHFAVWPIQEQRPQMNLQAPLLQDYAPNAAQ